MHKHSCLAMSLGGCAAIQTHPLELLDPYVAVAPWGAKVRPSELSIC